MAEVHAEERLAAARSSDGGAQKLEVPITCPCAPSKVWERGEGVERGRGEEALHRGAVCNGLRLVPGELGGQLQDAIRSWRGTVLIFAAEDGLLGDGGRG